MSHSDVEHCVTFCLKLGIVVMQQMMAPVCVSAPGLVTGDWSLMLGVPRPAPGPAADRG